MAKTLTTQSLDLSAFSSKLAEQYTVEHIISTQSSELVLQIRSKSDAEDYVLQIYSFSYPLLRQAKKMQSNHPDMLLLHENGLLILLSPSFIELLPKEQSKRNAFLHSKYLPYVAFLFCSCLFLYSIHDALRKKNANTAIAKHSIISAFSGSQNKKKTATGSALSNQTNVFLASSPSSIIVSPPDNSPAAGFPATVPSNFLDLQKQGLTNVSLKRKLKQNQDITILAASYNQITSCKEIAPLSNVKELYLNTNKITSIQSLSACQNLSILVLSDNKLQDIGALQALSDLTILDLSDNPKITKIHCLSSLTKLQFLLLQNTGCSRKEISYLQKKLPLCTIFY